jgi:hypothetical protein
MDESALLSRYCDAVDALDGHTHIPAINQVVAFVVLEHDECEGHDVPTNEATEQFRRLFKEASRAAVEAQAGNAILPMLNELRSVRDGWILEAVREANGYWPEPIPSQGSGPQESAVKAATATVEEPFDQYEAAIMKALNGKAMKVEQLAGACHIDSGRLYRRNGKSGPLERLKDRGLIKHKTGLGYYRTDAPPTDGNNCLKTV